jgi:dTDP-glucose pyrophosphorylase
MKPSLLVLAAGMGSRYGGLKQVDRVGPSGETIVDYSLYDAKRAGFNKIVFVIRKDIEEAFREVYHEKLSKHFQVEYVYQELDKIPEGLEIPEDRRKPWGTAHAVMMGEEKINEPFAVINADDYYGVQSYQQIYSFLNENTDENRYCMVGYQLGKTLSDHGHVSRGVCTTDDDKNLIDVEEHTHIEKKNNGIYHKDEQGNEQPLTGNEVVSMNMWGFMPSFFKYSKEQFIKFINENIHNQKAEFYIPSVVNNLIQSHQVELKVLETNSHWFGVTYKEDKPEVIKNIKALVENGVYPENLWEND